MKFIQLENGTFINAARITYFRIARKLDKFGVEANMENLFVPLLVSPGPFDTEDEAKDFLIKLLDDLR